jgi:hypothetical protein
MPRVRFQREEPVNVAILIIQLGRGVGFSHGLCPWKSLREGGAINQ